MKRKEEGITLIALVITTIILLILAGVTINWIIGDNSIFDRVELATRETKRAEIIEYLDLTLIDEQIADCNGTTEKIIMKTYERVAANGKNDLKSITKEVEVMQLEIEQLNENEEKYYFYVVADEEVYKVEANGARYLGKRSSEEIELQEAEIKFDYSNKDLTNQDVIVTISTTKEVETTKILYRINGTGSWQEYNEEGKIKVDKNCSIDVKVTIFTGVMEVTKTATGNVQNIDKLAPKSFTPESSKTTNSIKVIANTEDHEKTDEYAMSGEVSYSFSQDGTTWSGYQTSGEYTFNDLTQNKKYIIQIKAKDKVGNEMAEPVKVEVTTEKMTGYVEGKNGQEANITFDLPTDWTKEDVTVTASTNTNYKIQTSIDTKTWTYDTSRTLTTNGSVYARLVDSTGQFAEGSYATANVTCIDKASPKNLTPKISVVDNKVVIDATAAEDEDEKDGYGKSGISKVCFIEGSEETEETSKKYTFKKLSTASNNIIKIKLVDNAKNEKVIEVNLNNYIAIITFNPNGGQGTMENIVAMKNADVTLTQNKFTNGYKIFKNWNTKQDKSGTTYEGNATITPNENITLYATWSYEIPESYEKLYAGVTECAEISGELDADKNYNGNFKYGAYLQSYINTYKSKRLSKELKFNNANSSGEYYLQPIFSGTNTYELEECSDVDSWVSIWIKGGGLTSSVQIGELKLGFNNGEKFTLQEAAEKEYISPNVIYSSFAWSSSYIFKDMKNIISGGKTTQSSYPGCFILINVGKIPLKSLDLYSSRDYRTDYADGLYVDQYNKSLKISANPW